MKPDGTLLPCGYESFGGLLDYPVSAHPQMDGNKILFHSYTTNTDLIARDGPMKVGIYDVDTKSLDFYFSPTNETYISFAHSMMYTKNYVIIWDCNVHFDARGMFDGGSFFRAKPDVNLRFGIIPRNATSRDDAIWIDTGSPAAIVHPLNTWEDEEDGSIVMWTPRCENLVIDLESDDVNLFNMVEYRLDPVAKTSTMIVIDDNINVEFSVSPELGKFTRWGYTAIQDPMTPGEGSFRGFCSWDMQERTFRATYYERNEVGGEPMVAQTPDGKSYVATYTFDLVNGTSYFVLFDGKTSDLVCKLRLPHRVPFGFHGQWIPGKDLRNHFDHHEFTFA
jgi:carotenoid cleavage dioxygenase-like enzyme